MWQQLNKELKTKIDYEKESMDQINNIFDKIIRETGH